MTIFQEVALRSRIQPPGVLAARPGMLPVIKKDAAEATAETAAGDVSA